MNREPGIGSGMRVMAVPCAAAVVFLLQFAFRFLDDNRLTSWEMAFSSVDGPRLAMMVLTALAAAAVLIFLQRHHFPFLLMQALLAFCLLPVFWQEPEVIIDASRYIAQAKFIELNGIGFFLGEWGRTIQPWTDLPAVPFLYGLIFRFAGECRIYIQLFTTLLFASSVLLTGLIGRELFDEETGTLAGWCMLCIPYLYTQVPLMLVDVPTMFFVVLTVYLFIRGVRRGGWWIPFAGLAFCVTVFAKYSTWIMLGALLVGGCIIVAVRHRQRQAGLGVQVRRGLAIAGIGMALVLTVILIKHETIGQQLSLLVSFQRPGLKRWGESFTSSFLFQVHPFVTAFALFSAAVAARERDARYLVAACLPLLVVVMQIRRIRYIIMVFPFLCLAAAYGIAVLRRDVRTAVVACAVGFSVVVAIGGYLPFMNTLSAVNLRDAGGFIDRAGLRMVEVATIMPDDPVANPAVIVPMLDYFTRAELRYRYQAGIMPDRSAVSTSRLRFTWEYESPAYYATAEGFKPDALVVIHGESGQPYPDEISRAASRFGRRRTFMISEDIFALQTFVSVFY